MYVGRFLLVFVDAQVCGSWEGEIKGERGINVSVAGRMNEQTQGGPGALDLRAFQYPHLLLFHSHLLDTHVTYPFPILQVCIKIV